VPAAGTIQTQWGYAATVIGHYMHLIMKYFKATKDWQFNSRILKTDNKWLYYGEGYREATRLIEHQILEVDRSNQDFLIYPYCYLIRHYIEIRLKEIIDEGSKIINNPIDPVKVGHNLLSMWELSQEILAKIWSYESFNIPKDVFDFIHELHLIDVKSDNFRYPIEKTGKDTLENIKEINFKILSDEFHNVRDYLDAITDILEVMKDDNGL
jgi:hypothetical protein